MKKAALTRSFLFLFSGVCTAHAQQPVGTVGMRDASVQGALEVRNGQAILVSNTTVTALDHAAEITLNRGGTVRVCATSGLHITTGNSQAAPPPLMLALDRGALEIKMPATTSDVIMTPDLRFTARGQGTLNLELRVTRNGDTCVENRGAQAPTLSVADPFGEASYELRAGQHVLFEHGSLKEVVDHETTSCGCPPEPTMNVADALLHPGTPGSADTAAKTQEPADPHPFPTAVSEGLAPAAIPHQQTPPGVIHSQVSATLTSNGTPDSTTIPPPPAGATPSAPATSSSQSQNASSAPAPAPATPQPEHPGGIFHAVGRFFHRLFGGS